jgi:hypothetical protein
VVAEIKVVKHVYDIVGGIMILLSKVVQDAHFNKGLVVKPLLISKTTKTRPICLKAVYNIKVDSII